MQSPILNRVERTKRALGVQAALEWAYRIEKALLELPPLKDVPVEGFGFSLEYVLLQRAALGCKVDGDQDKMGSYTHPDAEVIAATVAGMPDSLGGIRMAIRVAELARAGRDQAQSAKRAGDHGSGRHRTGADPRQMANGGGFGMSGHLAAASGTDRIRPARIRGLVAGAGLVAGWADRGRDAARS